MRVWDKGGSSTKNLDYSDRNGDGSNGGDQNLEAQIDPVCTLALHYHKKKILELKIHLY